MKPRLVLLKMFATGQVSNIVKKVRENTETYYMNVDNSYIMYNPDGPSFIVKYASGQIRALKWTNQEGKLHNDNEPAYVEYYEDGTIKYKIYMRNGKKHNEGDYSEEHNMQDSIFTRFTNGVPADGNARIIINKSYILTEKYKNGKLYKREWERDSVVVRREWFKNNVCHRDNDKPAVIDLVHGREWRKYGKLHRNGKPALIYNGISRRKAEWYLDGRLHRIGAPASLYATDFIACNDFYLDGVLHNGNDLAVDHIDTYNLLVINRSFAFMGVKFTTQREFEEHKINLREAINTLPMPIADEILEQLF